VVGKDPLPRTELTKKLWEYIRKHELQDPKEKRNIRADEKLRPNLQPARGLPLNQLMRQTISGSAKTMQKMRGRAKIL
jgi:chromatin remodeling complex protein RSC6